MTAAEPATGERFNVFGALLFGALLALGSTSWPALRAAAAGLDEPLPDELWAALALAVAGGVLGLAVRPGRRAVLVCGLLVALGAVAVAAAAAVDALAVGDREAALWIALTIGVALGAIAPGMARPGRWLALLASAVAAVAGVAAIRLFGADVPTRVLAAALLLAPPVALLLAAGRGADRVGPTRALPAAVAAAAGCWFALAWPTPFSPPSLPAAAAASPQRHTLIAQHDAAAAVYDRSTQGMQLWHRGALVAEEGPDRPRSPLLATIVAALTTPGDRVLVLGAGTGRLPRALQRAGVTGADVVTWRTAARPLFGRLAAVGPVADPRRAEPAAGGRITGCRAALARLPAGSRQAIVVGDPLHAGCDSGLDRQSDWQHRSAGQAELRRVAGDGLVLQPFAMDRAPPAALSRLLAAAAAVHPWNGVLAVGECAVLVSAAREPAWPHRGAFASWSDAARWQSHEAHIGDGADLQRAWLGTVRPASQPAARPPVDGGPGPGRRATLRVLHECLEPAPVAAMPRAGSSPSLLLWWVDVRSRIRAVERALAAVPEDASDEERLRARAATLQFLPMGSPTALLQAALALPDAGGLRLRAPELAALNAFAIDPTFWAGRPPLLADLPRPKRRYGDLEDLADLPPDGRLFELFGRETTLGTALRVRFPSACARVLVEALANGPLPAPQRRVLRELADPFVLEQAGRVLGRRGATPELLGLWRGDLAMPRALRPLLRARAADRTALAAALGGRRDAGSIHALADLLLDDAAAVRGVAADALVATAAGSIEYDPKWPRRKRFLAAERVRALHNRAP